LGRTDDPKKWQLHAYAEIMRNYAGNKWRYFENPRSFGPKYGRQKGWEKISEPSGEEINTAPSGNQVSDNQKSCTIIQPEKAVQMGMPVEWLDAG